jgi:hypothetical protein
MAPAKRALDENSSPVKKKMKGAGGVVAATPTPEIMQHVNIPFGKGIASLQVQSVLTEPVLGIAVLHYVNIAAAKLFESVEVFNLYASR